MDLVPARTHRASDPHVALGIAAASAGTVLYLAERHRARPLVWPVPRGQVVAPPE